MKTFRAALIVPIAAVAMLLTACTTAASSESAPQTGVEPPAPAPTIDPGPVQLSESEAAERYLNLVCPNNIAGAELAAAFDAGEEEFLNGGTPDPSTIKAAAEKRVNLGRATIELLDDSYYLWPESVRDQVPHIRSSYMAELSTYVSIQNAETFEDAYYSTWPVSTPEQTAAGQEIRYQLALDADTVASCIGREGGVDLLTAGTVERDSALGASIED